MVATVPCGADVATTPVNAGILKYVLAHASAEFAPIEASPVKVTVDVPRPATTIGLTVCTEPLVPDANVHDTNDSVLSQPVCALESRESEYPGA